MNDIEQQIRARKAQRKFQDIVYVAALEAFGQFDFPRDTLEVEATEAIELAYRNTKGEEV